MRIVSFNINGIKSFIKFIKQEYQLSLDSFFTNILKADIICFQEMKSKSKDTHLFSNLKNFITFTNLNKYRNGLYGVSTFVKKDLYCMKHNLKVPFSDYGRAILTDHKDFKVLNLYFPFYDGKSDEVKNTVYKFYEEIYSFISQHDDIVVLGDFNCVYSIFDHFIYYKEFNRIFNREHIDTTYTLQIPEKIINRFYQLDNEQWTRNLNLICKEDISDKKLFFPNIFGEHLWYFLNTNTKIVYISYIHKSVKYLKFIKLERSSSMITEYKLDLIEKPYYSMTDLPYLVDSVSTLTLLFYGTYQRNWMLRLIQELKYIDSYRYLHSEHNAYTCWNTLLNLRSKNLGTRIDYIFVPVKYINRLRRCDILDKIYGSDHCPVYIDIDLNVEDDKQNILKVKNNLLDFFKKQV